MPPPAVPPAAVFPLPEPDELSAPFFEGLRRRELRIQRCAGCGTCQLAEHACNACGSGDLHWIRASGKARLYTFTVIHVVYHKAFESAVPYNAALVELEEGPRLYANIIGCGNEQLTIGAGLRVEFNEATDVRLTPAFAVAEQV